MTALITDLIGPILPYLIAAAGALLGGWGYGRAKRREGRREAEAKAAIDALTAHRKTTERMQDADAAMGDDPAVLRDRLRKRDPNVR